MKKKIPDNSWISIREKIMAYIHKEMKQSETDQKVILPTDKELTELFNCSLSPVKKALEDLKVKGVVQRKQGTRTVAVSSSGSISENTTLTGLSEKARIFGSVVKNNVMYWGLAETVPESNDLKFHFLQDKNIYRLKRLRFIDSEPRVIQDTFFCDFADVFSSNVITYHNFSESSLFAFYRAHRYNIVNRTTMIQAVNLDKHSASLLNVSTSEPVLQSNQITYATHDNCADEFVLEYMTSFYTKWKYVFNRSE